MVKRKFQFNPFSNRLDGAQSVDDPDDRYVEITGDTMTGDLAINSSLTVTDTLTSDGESIRGTIYYAPGREITSGGPHMYGAYYSVEKTDNYDAGAGGAQLWGFKTQSTLGLTTGSMGTVGGFESSVNNYGGATVHSMYGSKSYVANSGTATDIYGTYSQTYNLGGEFGDEGNATNMYGVYSQTAATGLVTNLYGMYLWNLLGDTVTNSYGLYITDMVVGEVTNMYGIYIDDIDGGSTLNYSIYSAGGNVELTDGDLATTGNITGGNLNISNWDTAYSHSQIVTGNPHNLDSDDVTEGTNLYFTEARVTSTFTYGSGVDLNSGNILVVDETELSDDLIPFSNSGITATDVHAAIVEAFNNSGSSAWGNITGTLSNQADLQAELNLKFDAADFNTDFDTRFGTKSTTNLSEGTNLYYTEVRVSANSSVVANTSKVTESTTVSDTNTINLTLSTYDISADILSQNSTTIDLSEDASGLKADLDSTLKSNYDSAYSHISATGASHTYIDQSVISGATPTFTATNITGVLAASILAGTFGTGAYTFDSTVSGITTLTANTITDDVMSITGGAITSATLETVNIHADVDTVTDSPATNEVLKWDGSNWVPATYDYTFAFSIASFTDNESTTQLIGSGVWETSGDITFGATYNNGPPTSASIALTSDGGVTWEGALTVTTPFTSAVSGEDTDYPSAKDKYIRFTLTGNKSAENDTDTETVYFRNYIYWGVSTTGSGFSEADVEALANSAISNDQTRSMALTPGANDYLVFAFPSSYTSILYGDDYEDDSTSGFLYNSLACAFQAPETVSLTNSAGFTEDYKVYASYQKNLGSHTLVTSTSATQINPLYYGVTSKTDTFLEADIEGLANSEITNDNTQSWDSVTAGAGEYMLFAFPKRLGIPTFWVGGFEGGFESPETVSVTNTNGWTEDYYAWRSENANLGATEVETK